MKEPVGDRSRSLAALEQAQARFGQASGRSRIEGVELFSFARLHLLVGCFEDRIGFVATPSTGVTSTQEGFLGLLAKRPLHVPGFVRLHGRSGVEGILVLPPLPLGAQLINDLSVVADPFWFVGGFEAEARFIQAQGAGPFFDRMKAEGLKLSDVQRACLPGIESKKGTRPARTKKARPAPERTRFAVKPQPSEEKAPLRPHKAPPEPELSKEEQIALLKKKARDARAHAEARKEHGPPPEPEPSNRPVARPSLNRSLMSAQRRRRRGPVKMPTP